LLHLLLLSFFLLDIFLYVVNYLIFLHIYLFLYYLCLPSIFPASSHEVIIFLVNRMCPESAMKWAYETVSDGWKMAYSLFAKPWEMRIYTTAQAKTSFPWNSSS